MFMVLLTPNQVLLPQNEVVRHVRTLMGMSDAAAWLPPLSACGESLYELPVGPKSGINNRPDTGGKEGPQAPRQPQRNR